MRILRIKLDAIALLIKKVSKKIAIVIVIKKIVVKERAKTIRTTISLESIIEIRVSSELVLISKITTFQKLSL